MTRDHAAPRIDPRSDDGSIIPLVLGFFVIALLLVGGSVAASDAFVGQRDVQSICDGVALAAASAVDVGAVRGGDTVDDLRLGSVQAAADSYLARDGTRQEFEVVTGLSPDAATVTARCSQRRPVALGQFFGLGDGIVHIADSTARTRVVR